ncbi:MAG: DUF4442 domain-containing protein [Nitriliruptoraceae bacterium]|nr:DUF4442 domain-containing protein [Nitriliruptoraceae bacterium]
MSATETTGDALIDGLVALGAGLPFNRHLGVEVVEVATGRCVTRLPQNAALDNHLQGVHAIAELAPVELAGALAVSSRLRALLERGYVPVVGALQVRYTAPAAGTLIATAEVAEEVIAPALAAADEGHKPRVEVDVVVHDPDGVTVAEVTLTFVYLPLGDGSGAAASQ